MLHPPNRIADYSTLLELLGPEGFERTACPVDVTDFVLKAIQDALETRVQKELSDELRAALDRRLVVLDALGAAYSGDRAADRAEANRLGTSIPVSGVLARLGDRSLGHSGSLDPFQFLYRELHLPPISLDSVWEAHSGLSEDLFSGSRFGLTLSEGPRPSTGHAWSASNPVRGGAVECLLHVRYTTEVLEDLQVDLETILGHVGGGGTIQSLLLGDVSNAMNSLVQEVGSAKSDIEDVKLRLIALQNDASELRQLVENL